MAKDYATRGRFRRNQPPPASSGGFSTNILWLIIGLLSGVLLANLGVDYIKQQVSTIVQRSPRQTVALQQQLPTEPSKPIKKEPAVAPAAQTLPPSEEKVNFDFYTILPNSESTSPPPANTVKSVEQTALAGPTKKSTSAGPAVLPTPEIKVESKTVLESAKKTEKKIEKVEKVDKTLPASGGGYILQISSFRKLEDADQLKAKLTLIDLEAKIKQTTFDGMTWYRVWLGVYPTLEAAEKAQKQLQAKQIRGVLAKVK